MEWTNTHGEGKCVLTMGGFKKDLLYEIIEDHHEGSSWD